MKQDLIEWLNSRNTEQKNDTGLLLAPINDNTSPQELQSFHENFDSIVVNNDAGPSTVWNDNHNYDDFTREIPQAPEYNHNLSPSTSGISGDDENFEHDSISQDTNGLVSESLYEVNDPDDNSDNSEIVYDTSDIDLNSAWHGAGKSTDYVYADEPPSEVWTNISDEQEYPHDEDIVEQRSNNFTQRLQKILQGRKDKAAEVRKNIPAKKSHSGYRSRALLLCSVLLSALVLAWFALWYVQRGTPDSLNTRAEKLYEQGNFNEAMNLYQRAYRIYPDVLTFLTGLARSAEKSGHVQTANTAWNEYINLLPGEDTRHRNSAQLELDRLNINNDERGDDENHSEPPQENITHKSFDELLREGSIALNQSIYNDAVINFFNALELRSDDIRPYIGLAASYRAKGLYFDAKRILDEARKIFRNNPTIETELKFLEGE